jgi:hypothetical protein
MPNNQAPPMRKFKYQLVIEGELQGPTEQSVNEMLIANISIPLALADTVRKVHVATEPISKIQIVKPGFDERGIKLEK